MDAGLYALGAAGIGLAGVVIGRYDRGRDELRAARTAYLAAIDSLAMFLAGVNVDPSPGAVGRALDKAAETLEQVIGPDVTSSVSYAVNRPLVRRMEHLIDQFWAANSRLALAAPAPVLEAAQRANALLGRWGENPGPQLVDEWAEVRPEVGRALRDALDSRPGRALRNLHRQLVRHPKRAALPATEARGELGTDLSASSST